MPKCEVCAFENEPGAEYCEECGVKISVPPPPPPPAPAPLAEPDPAPTLTPAAVRSEAGAGDEAAADKASSGLSETLRPGTVQPPAAGAAAAADVAQAACPACGAPVGGGVRFCPRCGASTDAGAPAPGPAVQGVPARCPACQAEAEPGAVFCFSCGTRIPGAAAPVLPAGRAKGTSIRLRMVAGKDKDRLFEVDKGEIRLGRLAENDIPLETDGYVSGKHTRVSRQGDEFFVEDLGSTNGTFLKVRKMTRIMPGDEIKVGQSIFRLE
jgi:hypothetical protein